MSDLLSLPPGTYHGTLEGPEAGDGWARIEARHVTDSVMTVDYEAYGAAGLQHVEHTVVSSDGLYVTASELPAPVMFHRHADGRFVTTSGPVMEIRPAWDGDVLTWSWVWAPPGEEPREQSRATLRRSR